MLLACILAMRSLLLDLNPERPCHVRRVVLGGDACRRWITSHELVSSPVCLFVGERGWP